MKVILDIKDSKAASLLEVLKGLSYVKIEEESAKASKSRLYKEIKEAVEEMKLIHTGKKEGRDARELLNEL